MVVGIARGGLFPATAVACGLRCEFFPVRLTRRVKDQPTFARPIWQVDVSAQVADKVVAVIDEIADTGETLVLAAERIKQNGAARVVTVSLVSHSWAKPMPDVTGLVLGRAGDFSVGQARLRQRRVAVASRTGSRLLNGGIRKRNELRGVVLTPNPSPRKIESERN